MLLVTRSEGNAPKFEDNEGGVSTAESAANSRAWSPLGLNSPVSSFWLPAAAQPAVFSVATKHRRQHSIATADRAGSKLLAA